MQYHYHLQGFIYSLLENSKYHYIHDKEGYKFFCFSNIFPITNILEKNNIYNLLLSSPNNEIVKNIYEELKRLQKLATEINIGHMKFWINFIDIVAAEPPNGSPFSLITGTPIIIRIPREKYSIYGINPKHNYDYLYCSLLN
jgi:CRISPR-associated endoribonuclease Cas6